MNNRGFLLCFVVMEQQEGNKQINVLGFFPPPKKKSKANTLTVPDEGMDTGNYYGMRLLVVSFTA